MNVFEESIDELYEMAPCGYVSYVSDRTVVKVNQTLLGWLGRAAHEVVGRPFTDLLNTGGRVYFETHLDPLLALEGHVREIALELVGVDGSRLPVLVNIVAAPATPTRPLVYRATVLDATDRRAYERELLAARRQAERRGERLAVLQQLAGGLCAALDSHAIANVVADAAKATVGADVGILWLVGPDDALHPASSTGWSEAATLKPIARTDVSAHLEAMTDGNIRVVHRAEADRSYPEMAGRMRRAQLHSAWFVPFRRGGQIAGIVAYGFRDQTDLADDDFALLGALGDHTAAALERAAYFETQRDIASTLQHGLLAHTPLDDPRLTYSAAYVGGHREMAVGGDWYDVFPIDPDCVAIVVGDVVGGGLPAAVVMGQLRSATRALAQAGFGPGDVLAHLDTFAVHTPGAFCATVLVAVLDLPTGRLRYACAGHLPALLRHRGVAVYLGGGRNPLLGLHPAGPRAQTEHTLTSGDVLVLYTDGLVERRGEPIDLGLDRLAETVGGAVEPITAGSLIESLAPHGAEDDTCAVVLAYRP